MPFDDENYAINPLNDVLSTDYISLCENLRIRKHAECRHIFNSRIYNSTSQFNHFLSLDHV